MDPVTALAAANLAVNVIKGFVGSGDGGLGANLRAMNEKMDVVLGSLKTLQIELAQLATAIGKLPDIYEELNKTAFVSEQIWALQAQTGLWIELLQGAGNNPSKFSKQQIRS